MIKRRHIWLPLAAMAAMPAFAAPVPNPGDAATDPDRQLPNHYDEPLGIGLEGWPYPAPVRFFQTVVAGQTARMAYMDIGPTASPRNQTVVLLHGKNFDSSYWAGPIKDLTGAGYRVIVPDQLGFNKSSKPDIAYSFDLLAEATMKLLGSLQLREAAFLGHSTGGMLAVRIATAYPNQVAKLILEDPIGLVDYRRYIPPQTIETLLDAELRQTVASYRAFVKRYFPILPPHDYERFVEWRMRVALSGEYERFCKAAAATYQMIYREANRDLYSDIAAKSLIIVGSADQSAPLKAYASPAMAAKMPNIPLAAAEVVKAMPNGRIAVVDKVGHVPHLEAADFFKQTVLGFLAS